MALLSYLKRYPLTLLCAAGIWYLCLMRPPSVKLSFTDVPGFDKVVHVGMYAAMCGLLWFEYLRHHTRLPWACSSICSTGNMGCERSQ